MIGLDTSILVHSIVVQDEYKHWRAQEFLLERVTLLFYLFPCYPPGFML